MSFWVRFLGIIGVVLLGFGLLGFCILGRDATQLMVVHGVVGVVLLAIWFVLYGLPRWNEVRGTLQGREARFTAYLLFSFTVIAGILIAVNILALRHDRLLDLTEQKIYSLAPQSMEVLRALSNEVEIVGVKGLNEYPLYQMRSLFELYHRERPDLITLRFIDPVGRPDLIEAIGMKPGEVASIRYGTGSTEKIERLRHLSEELITGMLLRFVRGEQRKIYYVVGHGEPDFKSEKTLGVSRLVQLIEREHLQVEELVPSESGRVPDDAAAVLLVGPKKELPKGDREVLIQYLQEGGRMAMLLDPRRPHGAGKIAERFGIKPGENVVIDKASRPLGTPQLGAQPLVRDYTPHPILYGFSTQNVSVFNIASSVVGLKVDGEESSWKVTELFRTSDSAWAEHDLKALFEGKIPRAEPGADDMKGPVSLAAVSEFSVTEKSGARSPQGKLVVVGDSDWVLNANLHWYSNQDLALNTIGWLAEVEAGVAVRPRKLRASLFSVSRDTYLAMMVSSFVFPELILLLGLFVWWRRQRSELCQ